MKKLLTVLLALTVLLTLTVPARADMLWSPWDDFWMEHHEECDYEGRSYYANGTEGFVTLWNAPDGHKVEAQFENGTELWVGYIYEEWACVSVGEDASWVPLADLQLIYDRTSFEEECANRIAPYNGEFADYAGDTKMVNFYEYPGAAEIQETFVLSDKLWLLDDLTGTAYEESRIQSVFVDENGLMWGFVPYMDNIYGRINAWFCLDQPDGENFPLRVEEGPDLIPAQPPVLPAVSYAPYLLVGAVVIVTILLLWKFRKKK